jgi:hypothetical protein
MKDRLLTAVLVGGLAMLVLELRFEHREALGETWHAWIPLAYAATTLAVGSIALVRWSPGFRTALTVLFGVGLAVGLAGVWFHSGGHPVKSVLGVLSVWGLRPGQVGPIKMDGHPPALAPLAFCGLGTLGLLASWKPRG